MRSLVEHEEFELGRRRHRKTHVLGFFQHAAQNAARTRRLGIAVEFGEEERQVVFERDQPHGLGQNARRRVRIGRVPSRQRRVVVELIVGIPAQHHVAHAEAAGERGFELVAGHVFAAHDSVDIHDADLHERQIAASHIGCSIGGGFDLGNVHAGNLTRLKMWERADRGALPSDVSDSCTRSRPW